MQKHEGQNLKELVRQIPSIDIFRFYCGSFKQIGKNFISDIRSGDVVPSSNIDYINGDLFYKDFGSGEGFRVVGYVMKKFSISYYEALRLILSDFGVIPMYDTKIDYSRLNSLKNGQNKEIYKEKKSTIIKIKSRDFTEKDLLYWESFCWDKNMLEKANIKSISHYWITNDKFENKLFYAPECAYSFDYHISKGIFRRKLYFPFSEFKWLSNVDSSVVQGIGLSDDSGDILVITKSLKDCGVFLKINDYLDIKIKGVAPNNEHSFVNGKWWNENKNKWKRVVIWFDNDWTKKSNTGVENAKKFALKYGLEYFYCPNLIGTKDPSDMVKNYSLDNFIKYFKLKLGI